MQITINGRNIEAAEGSTILQTARREGIEIPTLCYLEGVNDIGSCRLCVVELGGSVIVTKRRSKRNECIERLPSTEPK